MIVVRLKGGLGNQMFQYALGRTLALKHDRPLLLETSGLEGGSATPREYSLDCFDIRPRFVTFNEIADVSAFSVSLTQQRRGFHPEIFELPPQPLLIVSGLWISEGYFRDAAAVVRAEFTFRSTKTNELVTRIQSSTAVAVHVRRGDYLSSCGEHFGFVGADYYGRAIALLAHRLRAPHFFVFSDDMDWCRRNLHLDHPHTFVDPGGRPDPRGQEDLRLMTLCQHFIIANSTFSWWAAWLGASQGKIVVAPRRWYRDDADGLQSRDIVPPGWAVV
jgi:hypothetical protein